MGPVLDSVARTNRVVIAGEDWRSFGIGAEVAARIQEEAFDYLDAPIMRVNQKEVPLPYAANLENWPSPTPKKSSTHAWKHSTFKIGDTVARPAERHWQSQGGNV